MKTKYKVHKFNITMTTDQNKLEQFLNSLEGEIATIIPNVTSYTKPFQTAAIDFLLIVEKVKSN